MPADNPDTGGDFEELAAPYRPELLAHCYRMVGSAHDAEDLVQETLLRAWRSYDGFDGRSSLRTWLYRIATNVCLTALRSSHRKVLPSGLRSPVEDLGAPDLSSVESIPWLEPIPTSLLDRPEDPSTIITVRDNTRLALIAALQRLPARQRAALILVDVVGYRPAEAAATLDLSVTAVRSLLQRARATLALHHTQESGTTVRTGDVDGAVVERYTSAFLSGDTAALAALLRADIEYEMPPIPAWFLGREAVMDHFTRRVLTRPRLAIPTSANGYPALATYHQATGGAFVPHAIEVLETHEGQLSRILVFLDRTLFPVFGLPLTLEGQTQ